METEFGTVVVVNDMIYRFVDQMNVETFGTTSVAADSLEAAVEFVRSLHKDGEVCWKR